MTQAVDLREQKEQNKKEFFAIMREILNSSYALLAVSFLVVLAWALAFPYVSIFMLVLYEVCVFIFCSDNPKACLLPIVSISYMLTTTQFSAGTWIYFACAIAICVITIGIYIFTQMFKYGKKPVRGKMWIFFLIAGVGNVLAGIVGHFDFLTFVIVIAMSLLVYAIYWFCLNFLSDYKEYFAKVLIFLALIISAEVFIAYTRVEDLMYALQNKVIIIGTGGTGEVNVGASFILLGVLSCFYLAKNNKKDYLFVLLAFLFDVVIFFTHCRIALFICAILSIIYFFIIAHSSPNKKILYIGVLVVAVVAIVFVLISFDEIKNIVSYYIGKGFGDNGRDQTWDWSWEQFLSSPIFGIGFVTRDPFVLGGGVPGLINYGGWSLVNPHNFILHFLTCTGVVGLLLNAPFYIKKYREVFRNFNQFKIFVLMCYISTIIVAFFDPTPMTHPFYVFISAILISFVERDNYIERVENNKLGNEDNNKTSNEENNKLGNEDNNKTSNGDNNKTNNEENNKTSNEENKNKASGLEGKGEVVQVESSDKVTQDSDVVKSEVENTTHNDKKEATT